MNTEVGRAATTRRDSSDSEQAKSKRRHRRFWYERQKLGYFDDPDSLILGKTQEVLVTGNDKIRAGGNGTLDYPVIIGILEYNVQRLGWNHQFSKGPQAGHGFTDLLIRPAELLAQNSFDLVKNGLRGGKPKYSSSGRV